jgi:hypothetical protein
MTYVQRLQLEHVVRMRKIRGIRYGVPRSIGDRRKRHAKRIVTLIAVLLVAFFGIVQSPAVVPKIIDRPDQCSDRSVRAFKAMKHCELNRLWRA